MRGVIAIAFLSVSACSGDAGGPTALFPPDYAATYQEVRACRMSIEHGFVRIRVLASPDALSPYQGRTAPFPTGSIVLKEERSADDTACTGPVSNFTVMEKLDVGADPAMLDWAWQETDGALHVRSKDVSPCSACHQSCAAPGGYDHTCTVP